MNRYPTDSDARRWDGKRVHRTTTYPTIAVSFSDIYVTATETDYLDTLAKRFYGDATLWWVIAQANGIKATLKAPTGQQLRIPRDIQSILTQFFSSNKQ